MILTQYVWTKKAQTLAVSDGLNESRVAGFPATFAYEPLEKNPSVAKSWLSAGFVELTDKPLPYLQFFWKGDNTCARTHMEKVLRENHIRTRNSAFGELEAEIGKDGAMAPGEYYHVEGNLYGIIEKPISTSRYFGFTPEELIKKNPDGYTKEEALLCDNNIHAKPFCPTLYNAVKKAEDYHRLGCVTEILQMLNNKYAVVSY